MPTPSISFVAAGATCVNGGGNLALDLPAGINAKDLLLIQAVHNDNVALGASGYTNVLAQTSTTTFQMDLWVRIGEASESAVTLTRTAGGVMQAAISAYRGVLNVSAADIKRVIDLPAETTTWATDLGNQTSLTKYNNFSPGYGYERIIWAAGNKNDVDYSTAVANTSPSTVKRYSTSTTSGTDCTLLLSDGELKLTDGRLVGQGQSTFSNGAGGAQTSLGACFGLVPSGGAPLSWQSLPQPQQSTVFRM